MLDGFLSEAISNLNIFHLVNLVLVGRIRPFPVVCIGEGHCGLSFFKNGSLDEEERGFFRPDKARALFAVAFPTRSSTSWRAGGGVETSPRAAGY
jgi:hypothetical protein